MDTRQQAIDAAFHVIAEGGVQGATYRKIAVQAQLSPGTLTYHFPTIDALLLAAFQQFADTFARDFQARMAGAASPAQACEVVTDLVCGSAWPTAAHLLLSFELYAMAARSPDYRAVMHQWMEKSQAALRLQFDADTARVMDAAVEGFIIHHVLGTAPFERARIAQTVRAIAGLRDEGSA